MIKGQTKIELFNAETGALEASFEDENLVTNAIGYLMNIEACGNRALDNYVFPIATNALGGLMLFDGPLNEDKENINFPGDAHLVGYADQASGTSARRGSYNPQESGPTDHGYVSVWDFGTSQANGTIKSVARTSRWAGSNPIYNYFKCNSVFRNGFKDTDSGWYPVRIDGEYLYMVKHNTTSHEIRLARVRYPLKRHRVADYQGQTLYAEEVASWNTESCHWQDTRYNSARDYYNYAGASNTFDGGDGYLYAITNEQNSGNSSGDGVFAMFKIRYSDDSWEKVDKQVVTVKGAALKSFDRSYVHVAHGYIYWQSYDSKSVYIINLHNFVDVRVVRIIDQGSSDYIYGLHWKALEEGGTFLTVYHYLDSGSYEYRNGVLYEDGVFFVHAFAGSNNPDYWNELYGARADKLALLSYYDPTCFHLGFLANYLGTINNLSSPIEKNASQTMKVTYTLTDVDNSEEV